MAGQVYALFVGIDDYLPPVNPLGGCVNDIDAISTLLVSMLGDKMHAVSIRDRQATRDNIIDGFRTHLGQAKGDDVALFYYSGHGSQELAAAEFWPTEPDHLNETIVCVDSRTPGQHDLADKELQGLVAAVAGDGAEVVLILDCCHSGSGARGQYAGARPVDQLARQIEPDIRPRAVGEYLLSGLGPEDFPIAAGSSAGARSAVRRSVSAVAVGTGEGRYVLLAACDSSQTAKEQRIGDQRRGVFSMCLQTALRDLGGHLTYADLVSLATTRVSDLAADQTPQLESAISTDQRREFLGGLTDRRAHHRMIHSARGWVVDAGLVHGIPMPAGGQSTVFAVYPLDGGITGQPPLATATVESVEPGHSRVAVATSGPPLDEKDLYAAVLQSWPIPALAVSIEGEHVVQATLSAALGIAGSDAEVALTSRDKAELEVVCTAVDFSIRRIADGRLVAAAVRDVTSDGADRVVRQLERIARWRRLRDLQMAASGVAVDDFRLDVHQVGAQSGIRTPALRLEYGSDGSRPEVLVSVTNTGDRPLYVAVLGLSDLFGVSSLLHQAWGEWLQPGSAVTARGGRSIRLEVADGLWQAGTTDVTDIVKVIASTQAFSAEAWAQGDLDVPTARSVRSRARPSNTFDRMVRRSATRGFADDDSELSAVEWGTASCTITTHRPRPEIPLDPRGDSGAAAIRTALLGAA